MQVKNRLAPSGPDEWTDAAREMFAYFEGPEAHEKGSVSNLMLTMAHHPKLAFAYMKFGGRLIGGSKLSPKLREIVVLYIGWRNQAGYEWAQHVPIGRQVGIGEKEIEAIKVGAEDPVWTDLERAVIRATEQLLSEAKIDDATWEVLAAGLDKLQLIELLFVIGNYGMLSWIINAFGIQPENNVDDLSEGWMHRVKT